MFDRYASKEMMQLWSDKTKYETWRKLWLSLAEAQHELGLTTEDHQTPRISEIQLDEMRKGIEITYQQIGIADTYEKKFKHDVVAHIHAFAGVCPTARDIIHLGATSCYVTDNTDLVLMSQGLEIILKKVVGVIDVLANFADLWDNYPTVAYTHYQPAQLTTVGKRACLWCHDLVLDLQEIENRMQNLKLRGAKGAVGTQDSFLKLFHGNHDKVRKLDELIAHKMGFSNVYPVTGQTYSRKIDSQIVQTLSGIAQSAHKFACDIRLLQHDKQVSEFFAEDQVGSSAMSYKKNPHLSERICGLSRFVMNLADNTSQTAAQQWLERTLDDSSNRRLVLPQSFMGMDSVLRLYLDIIGNLAVNREVIDHIVNKEFPFIITEEVLMQAVKQGGDRQKLHEIIRKLSMKAQEQMKGGHGNPMMHFLLQEASFKKVYIPTDPRKCIGRAAEQVHEFIKEYVNPIRQRYPSMLNQVVKVEV